jgi:hypothetical protein
MVESGLADSGTAKRLESGPTGAGVQAFGVGWVGWLVVVLSIVELKRG